MSRRGHSLAELIVTLSFLAATLGAVAATAVTANRRTLEAVRRQQAASSAAVVLDSLMSHADPVSGETLEPGGLVRWDVAPVGQGRTVRVTVAGPDGAERAGLYGFWTPLPPALPTDSP